MFLELVIFDAIAVNRRRKITFQASRVPKLHQEFWEVPLNLQEKCIVSGSQNRNRYKGVLPNEHSRVQLPGPQTYIHANYIKVNVPPWEILVAIVRFRVPSTRRPPT